MIILTLIDFLSKKCLYAAASHYANSLFQR